MVFLSREHLDEMHKVFPTLSMALKALEKRLQASKLTKAEEATVNSAGSRTTSFHQESREAKLLRRLGFEDLVFDPDESLTSIWKAWTFYLIVVQTFKVIVEIGFRVTRENQTASDAILVLIELFFVLDMYFYSRLGYYEFGSKIMDCRRIRARYFRSSQFALDVAALLPLFIVNWAAPARQELVNVNKLLRLVRLPHVFRRLEEKYINITLLLRLFKLLLYCVILSHLLGCIWFSFGFASPSSDRSWLPPASLESLLWSFGVLSGSNLAAVPETPLQCVFTVIVLFAGVSIFSFVVGHLSDVAELVNADTREFNAKLSSLRHLLKHFKLPLSIEGKLKTHYFFQRYHTITQEHVLERCLPPSLLTEIRLVHLHPMITKVAFLAGMEGSVTRMLVAQFCQVVIVKDQFVFRYGEEGSDMYFIFTGIVEIFVPAETLRRRLSSELKLQSITSPDRMSFHSYFPTIDPSKPHAMSQMKKVNELTAGGYFGEVSLFTSNPRSAHARSNTSCVLYKLSRRSLELVFDRYPEWKKKVVKIVNIQQEQQHLKNLYMQEQQETSAARASAAAEGDNVQPHSNRVKSFAENLAGTPLSRRRRSSHVSSIASSTRSYVGLPKQQPVLANSKSMRLNPATQESTLWIDRLLQCTEAQSSFHLLWLKIMCVATISMAVAIPYRNAFDDLERFTALPLVERAVEVICELLFAGDIWINWNMKDSAHSMELYERQYSKSYKKRQMWVDVVAAFPVDHFLADFYISPALRINRCVKLLNFPHYMSEISRSSVAYERTRLWTIGILWLILMHWCACAYFAVALTSANRADGSPSSSSWDSWAPPNDILFLSETTDSGLPAKVLVRRFLRSLFFAMAVLFKRGKMFTPDDGYEFFFTIVAAFVGFFLLAFLVSEIANLYVSYISNEVDFRTMHVAVDHYLKRWQIGPRLQRRCHAFLSSLWSSHRGVNYRAIFDEMPPVLRTESVLHIADKPLSAFCNSIFRPFTTPHPQDRDMDVLMHTIAQQLTYQGYPRDESVVIEGSVSTEMYFVARGSLLSYVRNDAAFRSPLTDRVNSRTVLMTYAAGDFFGEEGLLGYSVATSTVRTVRACDLLALSSEALLQVLLSIPLFHAALGVAVASYRDVCRRLREPSDASCDWGDVLLETLAKQKALWVDEHAQQLAGDTDEAVDSEDAWKLTGYKGGHRLGLMALAEPRACSQAFDRLVRVIVARGIQSDRIASAHSSAWYFPDSLPFMTATSSLVLPLGMSTTEASDTSLSIPRTLRRPELQVRNV
jgi:CRP-like cAMP-binding protein